LVAAVSASWALYSESSTISLTWLPSMPPAALIASAANSTPRAIWTLVLISWPVRLAMTPTVMSAAAATLMPAAPSARAPAAARRRLRFMVSPFP
jgi:hypothetical protein